MNSVENDMVRIRTRELDNDEIDSLIDLLQGQPQCVWDDEHVEKLRWDMRRTGSGMVFLLPTDTTLISYIKVKWG